MKLRQKIGIGVLLIRRSSGVKGKLGALRQIAAAASRSRLTGKARAAQEADVAANAWADYHLLGYVSRDINVRLDEAQQKRVWVLLPELNASVIFGGYIALFQFMAFLQGRGYRTGVLVLKAPGDQAALMQSFAGNALVHGVLAAGPIEAIGVSRTVRLSPGDMLVAYNWTTALVAARMARFLADSAYYYFAQEDERIFYSNDSYRFLAESVFLQDPRPRLICNSQKLLDHFRAEGLVRDDAVVGVFEQGLPPAALPDRAELAGRTPRRLAFYGRPEDHAKRNLMSIALLALARAKRLGAFDAELWEFFMLGSPRMGESFDLDGTTITCLPNQGYDAYRKTLTGFDLGISLMYAPHPSVPPFEMVRSGVVTVVNTTKGRPADWYRAISANFEPGEPTLDGLAQAIARAAARVNEVDARLAAASTYHPESWEQSFAHLPAALRHAIFLDEGQK